MGRLLLLRPSNPLPSTPLSLPAKPDLTLPTKSMSAFQLLPVLHATTHQRIDDRSTYHASKLSNRISGALKDRDKFFTIVEELEKGNQHLSNLAQIRTVSEHSSTAVGVMLTYAPNKPSKKGERVFWLPTALFNRQMVYGNLQLLFAQIPETLWRYRFKLVLDDSRVEEYQLGLMELIDQQTATGSYQFRACESLPSSFSWQNKRKAMPQSWF